MDPNEALRRLRRLCEALSDRDDYDNEVAGELAGQFEALDQWISKGGFLPDDWQRNQKANKHT